MQDSFWDQQKANTKGTFNAVMNVCSIVAFPVELCAVRFGTWGTRYLNGMAILGFFWPLVFAAFFGHHPRVGSLLLFWFLSIGLLLAHRIAGIWRYRRGYRCHSLFWGRCWLEKKNDATSQRTARYVACFFAIVFGLFCCVLTFEPLGALFMIGAVAKAMSDTTVFMSVEVRLRQMEDARIETGYFVERYRDRNGMH